MPNDKGGDKDKDEDGNEIILDKPNKDKIETTIITNRGTLL